MRLIPICILISTINQISAQSLEGKYRNYFGNTLEIKSDSTFYWDYHFDLASGWATGKWSIIDNTVHLNPIPVHDTLVVTGEPDSLVLSLDGKSERITIEEHAINSISSGGQLLEYVPTKLIFHKNRLYLLNKNGKIRRSKMRGILTRRKFVPWYFKQD